jgi:hypothetical protein
VHRKDRVANASELAEPFDWPMLIPGATLI